MKSLGKRPITDLIGHVFGRLTVRECVRVKGKVAWRCSCSCDSGKITTVRTGTLNFGVVNSCGCLRRETTRERMIKHGASCVGNVHPEYRTWSHMLHRCMNQNDKNWKDYGGRGISVCERWQGEHGFENFLSDVGARPSPQHSIDRWPNNDGNYEPGNVRWATKKEQSNNCRPRTVSPRSIQALHDYRRKSKCA